MLKRWYYRMFYKKYCYRMTLSERIQNHMDHKPGWVYWDGVYLKKGWWFHAGQHRKDKNWKKHPLNPINHDCYLNSVQVRLSGVTVSPVSLVDDPVEYYYICNICGNRLKTDNYDKGKD